MGVVYQADDTRLHRFVAFKFLPEDLARDPQFRPAFNGGRGPANAIRSLTNTTSFSRTSKIHKPAPPRSATPAPHSSADAMNRKLPR